jgi:hypothetical protein
VDQFHSGASVPAPKAHCQQLPQIVAPERGEHDVPYRRTGLAVSSLRTNGCGTDLVVLIRADEHQVLEIARHRFE